MNFKPPRDPNTPDGVLVLRIPGPGELCQVGSGECTKPAAEAHDNGAGGEFLVCADHAIEVRALSRLINEMTPNQIAQFEGAIAKASDPSAPPDRGDHRQAQ